MSLQSKGEVHVPRRINEGPALILGALTVRIGTPARFNMSITHKREVLKPSHLYAHLTETRAFILEKVQWGWHVEEQLICPVDLNEFGMSQKGLVLTLPALQKGEGVSMTIFYTGLTIPGYIDGSMFSLPIIWAEAGASLLTSPNVTLTYSVE